MSGFLLGPEIPGLPQRVVSLVPSLTEAVFQLGCGHVVVGRTRYCVAPEAALAVAEVGGTKDFSVDAVRALRPDLVLAAKEENPRGKVEQLARHVPVLVADPRGPEDVPELWRLLGSVLGAAGVAETKAQEVLALLTEPPVPPIRCVYFVWKDPFMAAGPATYVSRLLAIAGFANVVAEGSRRYPVVDRPVALAPEVAVHFYPDEPYPFALPDDLKAWGVPLAPRGDHWLLAGRIACFPVSGADLTWYPSRTARGLTLGRDLYRQACDTPRDSGENG